MQKISEHFSDAESVSRRMGDLLTLCKSRLLTSRRSALQAEVKLQVVEKDLDRMGQDWRELESSLEVARKLFDSQATSPGSDTPAPLPEGSSGSSLPQASDMLPAATGPERASALLDEVLFNAHSRSAPQHQAQERNVSASPLELLEIQKKARQFEEAHKESTDCDDGLTREATLEVGKWPEEQSPKEQKPRGKDELLSGGTKNGSSGPAVPPGRELAADYFYLATVPPPKPRRSGVGRNFYTHHSRGGN